MSDFTTRTYSVRRDVRGGCFACNGSSPIWTAPNAQAVAARHHDVTGHQTWCDVDMCILYGAGDGAAAAPV